MINWINRRAKTLVLALYATAAMLLFASPAIAQEANPFAAATSDVLQYGLYGLIGGGVIMGVLIGVRVGKAIYKTLTGS